MARTEFTTGLVRLGYPNLFKPRAQEEGGKEKYSAMLLIPKSDKKTIARFKKAIEEVKEGAKTTMWGGSDKGIDVWFRDGDEDKEGEEYEGMMFINCKSNYQPVVVDKQLEQIIDPTEVYAGCWGHARVQVYAYAAKENNKVISKGVTFGITAFQKVKDDTPLGGGVTDVNSIFESVDDDDMFE